MKASYSRVCSYDNSGVQVVSEVHPVEGDVAPGVAGVRGLGVALEILLGLQLGVLQHALHRVHVVLNVSHELHHPGQVDRDQETK